MAQASEMTDSQREFMGEAQRFAKSPTPKDCREHILQVCREQGYDPILASIKLRNDLVEKLMTKKSLRKDAGPMKLQQEQRYEVEIIKLISGIDKDMNRYMYPVVKAYDVQGEIKSTVTIKMIQFGTGEEIPGKDEKVIDQEEVDYDPGLSAG